MRVWAAILGVLLFLMPESALAQTRRAFIAGIGDYKSLTDLQKTLGDASGYAQVFRDSLKFEVTQAPANATRAQFNAAFGQFLGSIRPGDEVAFIFSGHGWSDGVEGARTAFAVLLSKGRTTGAFTSPVAMPVNG